MLNKESNRLSFIRNIIGFSVVTWVSLVISFLSTPLATRLYLPEELGRINLFSTYASLLMAASYFGLDQAFVRFYKEPPDGKSKRDLFSFCSSVSLLIVTITGVIAYFLRYQISIEISGAEDITIVLCMVLYAVAGIGLKYMNLSYRMEQNLKWYTIQGILIIAVTKVLYLAVGFWSASHRPAILSMTISHLSLMLIFAFIQRKLFSFDFLKNNKVFVKEIAKFAIPLIPITFMAWANNSVSQIVLRRYLGFATIGIYTTAVGLASMMNVIQTGFNAYWAPYVYQNYKEKNNNFWAIHKLIVCCLVFAGLSIILLQEPLFLFLGEKYRQSKIFFPFLLLSPICYTMAETTGLGINISKKTVWNLLIFSGNIIINLSLCAVLIPIMGVSGAAFAASISAIFSLAMRTYIGEKYYKSINNYHYLIAGVSAIMCASIANWALYELPLLKYSAFLLIITLAVVFFRKELALLWNTGVEILNSSTKKLKNFRNK